MKQINMADNIRAYRKQKGLTQERLAEVMGVTVGAVSKWESGASIPDIGMIVELADFFETSVDVLLNYGWRSGSMGDAVKRIRELRNQKKFDEAVREAEKALERYPNSFDVNFASAVMYSLRGVERSEKNAYRRALTLFERSLDLIAQNTDEKISQWSIRNHIAMVYVSLDEVDKALELMKKNNVNGLNNASIGLMLAGKKELPDEALRYLSEALVENFSDRLRVTLGYVTAYQLKGEYDNALDILSFAMNDVTVLRGEGDSSYMDRVGAELEAARMVMAAYKGDGEGAREYLRSALAFAKTFDAAPVHNYAGMRFNSGVDYYGYDDFGDTAVEGIRNVIVNEKPGCALLTQILEEIDRGKDIS